MTAEGGVKMQERSGLAVGKNDGGAARNKLHLLQGAIGCASAAHLHGFLIPHLLECLKTSHTIPPALPCGNSLASCHHFSPQSNICIFSTVPVDAEIQLVQFHLLL